MALERSTFPPKIKPNLPIRIVLDIDDTLASHVSKKDLEKNYMSWFRESDSIVNAIEDYILHPGAIEFIRYLYETPNVTFCFFSHGSEERNNLIVPLLLKRALCDKKYKHALNEEEYKLFEEGMKKNIFSRNDCSNSRGGGYHKDLKITLKPGDDLNSTILIDDQRSSLSNGQKPNGLIIEYADDLLFDSAFTDGRCDESDLLSVNHLFYATGWLERLFSLQSKSITQSLFELQYRENGIENLWLYKYGISLVSFNNFESLDIATLKNISYHHDNVPVLIKMVERNEIMIFGKPNGIDWAFTPLDPIWIKKITFPRTGNESILLENSRVFCENDSDALQKEIKNKNGHSFIKYEPRYELYKDNSLYVSGLKTLQQFTTNTLDFYGHNANNFFGLKKEEQLTYQELPDNFTHQMENKCEGELRPAETSRFQCYADQQKNSLNSSKNVNRFWQMPSRGAVLTTCLGVAALATAAYVSYSSKK